MTTAYSRSTKERDEALREDMKRVITVVEENSKPTKRWWHYLGIKPRQPAIKIEGIENLPTFTEQELAEKRAFLDGFNAGRTDGDPGPAYKLWRKMRDHEE
jgi:hypothetical protein